ncbi:MAG: hypothetical protein EAX81_01950 [Candidatus Thorarchaeota archaeon]|nr:hypothetical protein [Candidatus Thorarchaeota archaeon]
MIVSFIVVIGIISAILTLPLIFPSLLVGSMGYVLRWRQGDYQGWTYYGQLLIRIGDFEHAHSALSTAISIRSDYSEAWKQSEIFSSEWMTEMMQKMHTTKQIVTTCSMFDIPYFSP